MEGEGDGDWWAVGGLFTAIFIFIFFFSFLFS